MNAQVKSAVNKVVAELCAWSLQFATSGVGPLVGFEGEPFKKKFLALQTGWEANL